MFDFSPNSPEYVPRRRTEYHSINRTSPIIPRENNETIFDHSHSLSPSKVKWIDAVRTVTQLNQVCFFFVFCLSNNSFVHLIKQELFPNAHLIQSRRGSSGRLFVQVNEEKKRSNE